MKLYNQCNYGSPWIERNAQLPYNFDGLSTNEFYSYNKSCDNIILVIAYHCGLNISLPSNKKVDPKLDLA